MIAAAALPLAMIVFGSAAAPASAAAPPKTDIVFIFDTSGSMGGVLEEAKEEIKTLIAKTKETLPEVEFGVANVEDIPGYYSGEFTEKKEEKEYEASTEKPWHLWQSLTSDEAKIETAINELSGSEVSHFGGDGPEAYGRALYETATNSAIKWRSGARHEIVMIADNVPHTPNVNLGIPAELWLENPFDTGEEPEGKFGIPETQWKTGESLEFHKTLQKLDAEEKPLAMVDYYHTGQSEQYNYVHYWEYWAAETGGQAITADEGAKSLGSTLLRIIKESAEGIPPCPPGYERSSTTPCVKKPSAPPAPAPAPVPTPAPVILPPPTKPPVHGKVVLLEDGELIEEDEFLEEGTGEFLGEVLEWDNVAEAASLTANPFEQNGQQVFAASTKPRKCKKNYVLRHGKCIAKTTRYGSVHVTVSKAGKYRLRIKPAHRVLTVLDKGKRIRVRLTLVFTPAHTTDHIRSARIVTVHKKLKHKKK